ncbi:MAG TPA: MFS transporter [Candidatus Dormibacteraeota bacterium]|nr:MFS transporter [Candidatus Dormibacteraeota bacterium]
MSTTVRSTGSIYTSGGDLTRRQLIRAAIAATIGTTIEWFDTTLYGLLIPIALGRVFFPAGDPLASSLAGFVSLLVSFAARPVGGILFGHYGDRLGRKATLVVTLLLSGVASTLIGVLPTYAQAGVLAPVLLLSLRLLIGLSLGGEWGGAVLLTLEWSNGPRRGFWAAWPQIGVAAATVLGFLAIQGSAALVGPRSDWAWRLPFLASIVLVAVGLYVRLGVLETPTFSRLLERRRIERAPVLAVLGRNWREVALTALLRMGEQAPLLVLTTFFLVYATTALHVPQATAIGVSIVSGLAGVACPPLFGYLSDRLGRRRVFLLGAVATGLWAAPYFALLGTRDFGSMLLAATVGQVTIAAMAGPEAAFIAETFTGRLRYSGASIGAGLGAVISGGAASIVSVLLLQRFHSAMPVAVYVIGCCLVSVVAATLLRERSHQDLSVEYDEPAPRWA